MKSIEELSKIYLDYLADSSINKEPHGLYDPVNYIMNLGGKRIRPILLLMSSNLYENEVADKLNLAHSIEIFHNFTLVHDDIMDEAPLRRGKNTVHIKYDLATAILSGDVMILRAYDLILCYSKSAWCVEALKFFTDMGTKICEGQQWDMEFEKLDEVDFSNYCKMIEYKTAVLLGACMRMGAMSAGAGEGDQELLEGFAIDLGMAFQIQDDILDAFGEGSMVGKEIGGDIYRGKKTFLYICCLENLANDREEFKNVYLSSNFSKEEKLARVHRYFGEANVKERAKLIQENYFNSAMEKLERVNVAKERKGTLEQFARSLFIREQ